MASRCSDADASGSSRDSSRPPAYVRTECSDDWERAFWFSSHSSRRPHCEPASLRGEEELIVIQVGMYYVPLRRREPAALRRKQELIIRLSSATYDGSVQRTGASRQPRSPPASPRHSPVHPDGDHVQADLQQAVDVVADETGPGEEHLAADRRLLGTQLGQQAVPAVRRRRPAPQLRPQ